MRGLVRILRVIVKLIKSKECTLSNIVRNLYFNVHRISYTKNALLVCGKHTDIKLDKEGRLSLNANLYVGKKEVDKTHYKSWIWIMRGGQIVVDGVFTLYEGSNIHIHKGGMLTLTGGYMSENASIVCEENIRIGRGCAIAPGVVIRDCDSHEVIGSPTSKPIIIGEHVWIGTDAIILKGVTIGDGAVIGAGSVVTKDIPPRCVAVGNPAKIVKSNIDWK